MFFPLNTRRKRLAAALVGCVLIGVTAAGQGAPIDSARQVLNLDSHHIGSAAAQDPPKGPLSFLGIDPVLLTSPLITDRPDFTESTDPVPRGHVQLEMGYTFTYERESRRRNIDHTAPEILLRVGFADHWELRIGWAGYTWSESVFEEFSGKPPRVVTSEDWSRGSNDLILGFKYKFAEQEGSRPHLGIIGEISIPSGTIGVSSGDVDPAVKLLWAYDLSDTVGVAGNLNLAIPTEDGHRFVQASASLSLAISLSDTVGTYIEYFGFYPSSDGQDAAHVLNGGFTFLVSDNFQFDIRAGFGLNSQADDFVAGVGFSLRL